MRRFAVIIIAVCLLCFFLEHAAAERKLIPDGFLTDTTGRSFVRVQLNDTVPAVLLYQEDLPFVLLTRTAFRRLDIPLERQPAGSVRVGKRRVKVKKFLLRRICVGENCRERTDASVVVSGGIPAYARDGVIGRQMLEQLDCAM
jgi:hypothetical protein